MLYDKFLDLCQSNCDLLLTWLSGSELLTCQHRDHVNCIKFNPVDYNLFLSGLTDLMLCWDKRCPSKPVRQYTYKDRFGQVTLNHSLHSVSLRIKEWLPLVTTF